MYGLGGNRQHVYLDVGKTANIGQAVSVVENKAGKPLTLSININGNGDVSGAYYNVHIIVEEF
jgi:hypothetical protein